MKQYKIKAGKHSSGIHIKLHCGKNILRYSVRFDESCIYNLGDVDQLDINKLCGISFGLHHNNSARFGWACVGDRIELYAYCYVDKKRVWKSLGLVDINKTYDLHLDVQKGAYNFFVYAHGTDLLSAQSIPKTITCKYGYMLYPYFGGNDIRIELDTVMTF
jgi:hypothetical protein